jgi:elongation factor P hydroxylase
MSNEPLEEPVNPQFNIEVPDDEFKLIGDFGDLTFDLSALTDSRVCRAPDSSSRLLAYNLTSMATLDNLPAGIENTFYGVGAGSDVDDGVENIIIGSGAQAGASDAIGRIVLGGTGLYDNSTHINTVTIDAPNLEEALYTDVLYYDTVTGKIAHGASPAGGGDWADGSAALPAQKFAADTDTGVYRPADNTFGITTAGTLRLSISDTLLSSSNIIRVPDGLVGTPAYSFTSDTNTGIYLSAADQLSFAIGGVEELRISSSVLSSANVIYAPDGAVGAPAYSFTNATDTGMFNNSGIISFSVDGAEYLKIQNLDGAANYATQILNSAPSNKTLHIYNSSALYIGNLTYLESARAASNLFNFISIVANSVGIAQLAGDGNWQISDGSATTPAYSFLGDNNTGLYRIGADQLGFSTGGTLRLSLTTSSLTNTLPYYAADGTNSAPSYTFTTDTNTGMYRHSSDVIGFAANGNSRFFVSNTYVEANVPFIAQNGSALAPSYSFTSDLNTGMYNIGADQLGISTGGTLRLTLDTSAVTSTLRYIAPAGSGGSPSFSFAGSLTTGLFIPSTNQLGFTVNGTGGLVLNGSAILSGWPFRADGTVSSPAYSFQSATTSGLYYTGTANTIALATNGTAQITIDTTTITSALKHSITNVDTSTNTVYLDSTSALYASTALYCNFARAASALYNVFQSVSNSVTTSQLSGLGYWYVSDGAALTPSYSFINEPDTGMYLSAANTLSWSTGGTIKLTLSTTALTNILPYYAADGSAAAPAYSFSSDTDIGMYRGASDSIRFATAGAEVLRMGAAIQAAVPYYSALGSAGAPGYAFTGDADTGIYSSGADVINFATAGVNRFSISSTSVTNALPYYAADGAAATPSYTFTNDTNSGLYYTGVADTIALTTGGTARLTLNTTSLTSTLPIYAADGSASAPGYSFSADTNTGIYRSASDELSITTGNQQVFYIGSNYMRYQSNNTTQTAFSIINSSSSVTWQFIVGGSAFPSPPVAGFLGLLNTISGTYVMRWNGTQNLAQDGSASLPSYSFVNDTNSGLYYTGTADTIALTTGGTARLTLNTATCDSALPLRVTGTTNYLLVNTTDRTYRSTNGGATTDQALQIASNTVSPGYSYFGLDYSGGGTDMGVNFNMLNTSSQIIRTAAIIVNSGGAGASRTAGAEVGNMGFFVKPSSTSVTEWGRIVPNGTIPQLQGTTSGTASVPTYSFIGDTGTGMYRTAANSIGLSTNGTVRLTLNTTSLTSTLPIYNADGSAAAPAYSFASDTDIGMYRGASDSIRFATAGAEILRMGSAIQAAVPYYSSLGSVTNPGYAFTGDPDTGIYSSGSNVIDVTTAGTNRLSISSLGMTSTVRLSVTNADTSTNTLYLDSTNGSYNSTAIYCNFARAATASYNVWHHVASSVSRSLLSGLGYWYVHDGSATTPSYSFLNDSDSGMYLSTTDTIGWATAATLRLSLSTTALTTTLPIVAPVGAVGSPSYTFTSDTNTGIYSTAGDNLDVATAGVRRLNVDSSGNLALGASPSYGSGQVVIFIANATAVPSANPTGGGILYVEGGALKYRGSSGTISTLAPA